MISEAPNCYIDNRNCKWFRGYKDIEVKGLIKEVVWCLAFPNGIPDEIAYGNDLHKEMTIKQEGDYVFRQEDEEQEKYFEGGKKKFVVQRNEEGFYQAKKVRVL